MNNEKIQVDRVSREVIEGKLLASLDDGAHVAIVCSEVELTNLIEATATTSLCVMGDDRRALFSRVAEDLKKLRKEAFGR